VDHGHDDKGCDEHEGHSHGVRFYMFFSIKYLVMGRVYGKGINIHLFDTWFHIVSLHHTILIIPHLYLSLFYPKWYSTNTNIP